MTPSPTWILTLTTNGSSGKIITHTGAGVLLQVRVAAGASHNAIAGAAAGRLRVKVQAPPVAGKANRELVKYVAKLFGVSKSRVTIVRGQASREKTLILAGLPLEAAQLKLQTILPEE